MHKDLARKITHKHPSFESFIPVENLTVLSSVFTSAKKGNGLVYTQERSFTLTTTGTED